MRIKTRMLTRMRITVRVKIMMLVGARVSIWG